MDREVIWIAVSLRPNDIVPIVIVIGIFEGDHRALRAAPVIVCGIKILNIVIQWTIVDNIKAGVVLEDIVVGVRSWLSLSAHGLNPIYIALYRIILDIDRSLSHQNIHQYCLAPSLNDKTGEGDAARVDGDCRS